MFRSFVTDEVWRNFETLTLVHFYKEAQKQIINAFAPYGYVVNRYSEVSKYNVRAIGNQDAEDLKVSEQNIVLLKNAIEFWRIALQTSPSVAPVLYHYSLHCFISFFSYTFFKWEPEHVRSHGIHISKWGDGIMDIEVRISKQGLFQRLIDTWTILGACLAFSRFLPSFKGNEIEFIPNRHSISSTSQSLSLEQLLAFNSDDFEREVNSDLGEKRIKCLFLSDSNHTPTIDLRDYIIIFVASNIARYRPYIWNSILLGTTLEQSNFHMHFTRALVRATTSLLRNVSNLFQEIRNGKFKLGK